MNLAGIHVPWSPCPYQRNARGWAAASTKRCKQVLGWPAPARLWADPSRQMRGQKAEREIALIFDAPFPAPGAPGASGLSGPQVSDLVEQKSTGLEHSASTAEWLTRVVEAPHDFALVYNFVSNLLSDSDQPLGALTRRFATLFDTLFLPTHQMRKSFSAEALTEKLAGPAASRSRHASTIASAASSMHLGVNRLHRRCIDVLPPLQCASPSLAAMEAVQAALFELCGPTLHALVGLTVSSEDVALQARPRSNASPCRASGP